MEIGASNVYRLDPVSKASSIVVADRVRPNGLAFSPDERTLYVSDTGASHVDGHPRVIAAYTVSADGRTVSGARTFAVSDTGFFDGFRCDTFGNVWTSTGEGVRCYALDGTDIGTLKVPELVSNVCFGGLPLKKGPSGCQLPVLLRVTKGRSRVTTARLLDP